MEKFDKKKYLELVLNFYEIRKEMKYAKEKKFREDYIKNTVYEKYFETEKIPRLIAVERIKKGFERLKNYDLENIFLLGVSENNTEYILPIIEREVFSVATKNDYEMQEIYRNSKEEVDYEHSEYTYYRKMTCSEYLLDFGTILGVVENFEDKEYRIINANDEKKFIEMIKILENAKEYTDLTSNLFKSKFFSVSEIKYYDEEELNKSKTKEEKEVFEGQDFGKIANAFAEMFSIDNERCSQIVNGLWILGIVKTEENKDGSYDYKKLINEKTMACMGWFLDDCIIDYETIKKYFGKYKLIRKFCDERLEQQKNKEKNVIINYLNKVNKTKEFSIKEYKGIIKDFTYEEKKENLAKISSYLEKEINLEDVFIHSDDDEKHKFTAEKMFEYFKSLLKPREETFDSIRQWLLETIHQENKVKFPVEKLLNDTKMFDEQEKMRTFNVLKNAVDKEDYKIKLENGETLKGDNLVEYFGNLLGISMIK